MCEFRVAEEFYDRQLKLVRHLCEICRDYLDGRRDSYDIT